MCICTSTNVKYKCYMYNLVDIILYSQSDSRVRRGRVASYR